MLARTALRWVPARKPLRLCWAGSCGCSGARGARSVWAVTAGSNPLRPTTSAGITTVQVFARDDAVTAQRKCPWLQTPTPLRYDNTLAGDSILPITQPVRRLAQGLMHDLAVETLQETVGHRKVGYAPQFQCLM